MRPRYLFLAAIVGLLLSPAVHALTRVPAPVTSETHNFPVMAGFDPIAQRGYEGAVLVYRLTPEQSAARAEVVVVGRVSSMTSRIDGGTINTDVTVNVEKALKGNAGATVTFLNPGGKVGTRQLMVGEIP